MEKWKESLKKYCLNLGYDKKIVDEYLNTVELNVKSKDLDGKFGFEISIDNKKKRNDEN